MARGSLGERATLWLLLGLNGGMFVVELVAGVRAESMGLVADALDMLADALVFGLALLALGAGGASQVRAATGAGLLQGALALVASVELVRSLVHGSSPVAGVMAGVSVLALVVNVTSLALLRRHRHGAVHLRAAWIFSATDVQVNLAVVLAAAMVHLLESAIPDLVVAAVICAIVYRGTWRILREAHAANVALREDPTAPGRAPG